MVANHSKIIYSYCCSKLFNFPKQHMLIKKDLSINMDVCWWT